MACMAIDFRCERCGAHHTLPDNRAGLVTVCSCGADIQVPEPSFMGTAATDMELVDDASQPGTKRPAQDWEQGAPRSSPEEILRRERERSLERRRRDPTWKYRLLALAIVAAIGGLIYLGVAYRGGARALTGPSTAVRKLQIAMAARDQIGVRVLLTPDTADTAASIVRLPEDAVGALARARIGETRAEGDRAVVLALAEPGVGGTTRSIPVAFGLRRVDGAWLLDGSVTLSDGMSLLAAAASDGDRALQVSGDRLAARTLGALGSAGD